MTGPTRVPIKIHKDNRGIFARTFDALLLDEGFSVAQVNLSLNPLAYTLRGLHFQTSGPEEAKIISLISGSAFLVVVDIREESPTYLRQHKFELTTPLTDAIRVPSGFATGWLSTSTNTTFQYLMSARFEECQFAGLRFDDPSLSIDWPRHPLVISEQDLSWPLLKELRGET